MYETRVITYLKAIRKTGQPRSKSNYVASFSQVSVFKTGNVYRDHYKATRMFASSYPIYNRPLPVAQNNAVTPQANTPQHPATKTQNTEEHIVKEEAVKKEAVEENNAEVNAAEVAAPKVEKGTNQPKPVSRKKKRGHGWTRKKCQGKN